MNIDENLKKKLSPEALQILEATQQELEDSYTRDELVEYHVEAMMNKIKSLEGNLKLADLNELHYHRLMVRLKLHK